VTREAALERELATLFDVELLLLAGVVAGDRGAAELLARVFEQRAQLVGGEDGPWDD
jgi:hypothetical protein